MVERYAAIRLFKIEPPVPLAEQHIGVIHLSLIVLAYIVGTALAPLHTQERDVMAKITVHQGFEPSRGGQSIP